MNPATNDEIGHLMQMIFGLDHETPIHHRHDYDHSFFFDFGRQAKFFLSVWDYMMTHDGKATDKQKETVSKIVRENFKDMVSSFHNIGGAPITLAFVAYGREEGKKISSKFYDGYGNRKKYYDGVKA